MKKANSWNDFLKRFKFNKVSSFRILLIIVFTIPFLIIISYLDDKFITPLVNLPEDICYYHMHTPPLWVDLLYLDSTGHTEWPYTLLHDLILLIISVLSASFFALKLDKYLLKHEK